MGEAMTQQMMPNDGTNEEAHAAEPASLTDQFKANNPSDSSNEAWEAVEEGLPINKYAQLKQKVDGPLKHTAGKYGKKDKVRPSFGKVNTRTVSTDMANRITFDPS